jgi:hypothetical protein
MTRTPTRTLHIHLWSSPEVRAERSVLTGRVFPELRRRAEARGIELSFAGSDPATCDILVALAPDSCSPFPSSRSRIDLVYSPGEDPDLLAQRAFEDLWTAVTHERRREIFRSPAPVPPERRRSRWPAAAVLAGLFGVTALVLYLESPAPGGSRRVVKLSRASEVAPAVAEALPPPPENWKSWRDGARACGLGFSDLERIAKVARSAGRPGVEIGHGTDRPVALGLRQRLTAGGERAFVLPKAEEGKPLCSVWIGPLQSPQVAEELARRVSSAYGVDARAGWLPDIEKLGR